MLRICRTQEYGSLVLIPSLCLRLGKYEPLRFWLLHQFEPRSTIECIQVLVLVQWHLDQKRRELAKIPEHLEQTLARLKYLERTPEEIKREEHERNAGRCVEVLLACCEVDDQEPRRSGGTRLRLGGRTKRAPRLFRRGHNRLEMMEFIVRSALVRIVLTPQLWPHFANTPALQEFWALEEPQRRSLWGDPIDPADALADFDPRSISDSQLGGLCGPEKQQCSRTFKSSTSPSTKGG
jgi:hypothetical protein